jgi:hypothetical protein
MQGLSVKLGTVVGGDQAAQTRQLVESFKHADHSPAIKGPIDTAIT